MRFKILVVQSYGLLQNINSFCDFALLYQQRAQSELSDGGIGRTLRQTLVLDHGRLRISGGFERSAKKEPRFGVVRIQFHRGAQTLHRTRKILQHVLHASQVKLSIKTIRVQRDCLR